MLYLEISRIYFFFYVKYFSKFYYFFFVKKKEYNYLAFLLVICQTMYRYSMFVNFQKRKIVTYVNIIMKRRIST